MRTAWRTTRFSCCWRYICLYCRAGDTIVSAGAAGLSGDSSRIYTGDCGCGCDIVGGRGCGCGCGCGGVNAGCSSGCGLCARGGVSSQSRSISSSASAWICASSISACRFPCRCPAAAIVAAAPCVSFALQTSPRLTTAASSSRAAIAASSPPAEPPAPAAPGSRRAAKRAARKRDKQTGVSKLWGARLASDQSRHRRPAVPKLPPDTGGALHDSLIKRQWAAAESHLAAQPASASAVASGTAESGVLRCCGRGADLLPLHLALLYGAPKGLVSDLLAVYPRAARQIVSVSGSAVRGRRLLPLHIAMLASSDAAVVNLLIASNPAAAAHTCSGFRGYTELLPLHLAILCGAPAAVTRQVLT
eukprot:COSAG04_NODE_401_length_14952_cov_3.941224_1_plen_360_part_10